ncbi:MAG: family 43 glycosylhydrolase, partial [Dysgonamonadaceae bacterium]|nr:family 43 glycosylhydrolase [Dysgonamonadaceae bacterium]
MRTKTFLILLVFCALQSCKAQKINNTLEFSAKQTLALYNSVKNLNGRLPRSIDKNGQLVTSDDAWWGSGFTAGALWYLYEYTKCDSIKSAAEALTKRIERQQYTKDNHDIGFMIYCSFGNGYRLTKKPEYKEVIINAARSLSSRFNPVSGVIRSWDNKEWTYPVIIDNMMNLELLCEATKLSGDDSFLKIAVSHADTTLKYHFRPDGSSYHLVDYHISRSGIIGRQTHQGYADESAWARGQAWALYGYSMMYRETQKPKYLQQAIKIANFIINHPRLPADKIPYWDFDAPGIPDALRDASAGAVICSALIELSSYVTKNLSEKYFKIAGEQIATLSSPGYLAKANSNGNFILKHNVGHFPNNSEIDVPLPYADYYFLEALMRYKTQSATGSLAENPFIRTGANGDTIYTADPSAHVWADGRLYVYASHDIVPPRGCDLMDKYHVFSTVDMLHWKDHGQILEAADLSWGRTGGGWMWAPDCVYKNGIYYLYFPHKDDSNFWRQGVATSTEPAANFKDQGYIQGLPSGIDPCVFIDDDGQAYFYYKINRDDKINQKVACAAEKLKENILEIEGELMT